MSLNSEELRVIGNEFEARLRRVLESVLKSLNESHFNQFQSTDPTSESVTTTVSLKEKLREDKS